MVERDTKGRFTKKDQVSQGNGHIIGWIQGLPLTVSPEAGDILAAVWLGSQIGRQSILPASPEIAAPSGLSHVVYPQEEEFDSIGPGVIDMASLWSMSPEKREAILSQYGLQVAGAPPAEYDPTAETMKKVVEAGSQDRFYSEEEEGDE